MAPTIAISGDANVNEGTSYSLTLGAITDPGTDTVTSWVVHWGDGSSNTYSSGGVKTHTYADGPNDYDITVDLIDEDNTFLDAANDLSVHVNNVAPTVTAGFSANIDCRTNATLSLSFTDPGVNDEPWAVDIDWGDGSTNTTFNASAQGAQTDQTHMYTTPGSYSAIVKVTDKDGGEGTDTGNSITVNQTYAVDFLPPFDDSTPRGLIVNKMKTGRVVPVKVTLYDECALGWVTDPNTSVTIKVSKTSGTGGTGDPIEEYADAGSSSAGTNAFRLAGGFWIYNLDNKALGLVVNNFYRVDVYVAGVKATVDTWGVLQPVK